MRRIMLVPAPQYHYIWNFGNEMSYYGQVRHEILSLLPASCGRLLDVGCGEGATAAFIKEQGLCTYAAGVEPVQSAAVRAKQQLDFVFSDAIEAVDLATEEPYDLILCLDVLEHLVDPWSALSQLVSKLRPGGTVIVSIPNVRNFRVVLPLLLRGEWRYEDDGLLDRTHLRFFTRKSAIGLVEKAGLNIEKVLTTGGKFPSAAWWAVVISLGTGKPFFDIQYLIKATKPRS